MCIRDRTNPGEVGIIFDWENFWGLEYTSGPNKDLLYIPQIHQYYEYFYRRNIPTHMISLESDFSKYKVIIAPVLYMIEEETARAIERYVEEGGIFVTTFMSGIVNSTDNVHLGGYPGPLRKMTGVWVEEIDALAPEQHNSIKFKDGSDAACGLCCDIMHLEGAETVAEYTSDFYKGTPVITKNKYGNGTAYYIGSRLDTTGLNIIMDMVTDEAEVQPLVSEKSPLEIVCRESNSHRYFFLINFSGTPQQIPKEFNGFRDMLTGKILENEYELENYGVLLIGKESKP